MSIRHELVQPIIKALKEAGNDQEQIESFFVAINTLLDFNWTEEQKHEYISTYPFLANCLDVLIAIVDGDPALSKIKNEKGLDDPSDKKFKAIFETKRAGTPCMFMTEFLRYQEIIVENESCTKMHDDKRVEIINHMTDVVRFIHLDDIEKLSAGKPWPMPKENWPLSHDTQPMRLTMLFEGRVVEGKRRKILM